MTVSAIEFSRLGPPSSPRPLRHRMGTAALDTRDPRSRLVVVNDCEATGLRIELPRG